MYKLKVNSSSIFLLSKSCGNDGLRRISGNAMIQISGLIFNFRTRN